MSEIQELTVDERRFLEPFLPPDSQSTPEVASSSFLLPFVTLTYACSLDSMIALAPGVRTTLSGPETKCMTHYLRLRHEAILIGAGTAAVDNPGLNCRYPNVTLEEQPRPVIVDPNGRWDPRGKKAYVLASESSAKAPWVVARGPGRWSDLLEQISGEYVSVKEAVSEQSPSISWHGILTMLKRKGINSVMIEGGATVINALLAEPDLVSAVIVTIAPTFLGQGGVAVAPAPRTRGGDHVNSAWLRETSWRQFGSDAVLCGRLAP